MGEQKVTITATPSKVKQINVTSSLVANQITATPDTSLYNSNLSKQWATKMDGKVVNEDYSSKYYAENSKISAETAKMEASAVNALVPKLREDYNSYNDQLTIITNNSKTEITAVKNNSIDELNTTKNTAISNIQNQQTTSVNAVKTEGTTQVNLAKEQATASANYATQAQETVRQVEDELNSKVDIDDMVELDMVEMPTIIETSDPSLMPSYYIVYSNGWGVQGGQVSRSGTSQVVALLKEMKYTNYQALATREGNLVSASADMVGDKTTTSFTMYGGSGAVTNWQVSGYVK